MILVVLVLGSVGQALPTTVMDGTLHNGSLTFSTSGFWNTTPGAIPVGWIETSAGCYSTSGLGNIQLGSTAEATNNTGETVQPSHEYTVNADLGGVAGALATVRVYATVNSDGTGAKVLLSEVSRLAGAADGYDTFPVSITGPPAAPSLAGYYIQVVLATYGYYDNIGVTSEEGAFYPNGINFWENDRLHLPDYGASTNLILNPSFEAGFRFWGFPTYAQGIAPLEYSSFHEIDSNEVYSGSYSLRLRALTIRNPLPLGTMAIPLVPGDDYTLSFYAKGCFSSQLTLNVWGRGENPMLFPGNVIVFPVNDTWTRYTIPFTANDRFSSIFFDAKLSGTTFGNEGCVWLDDIQLEVGSVTRFVPSPVDAQLVSTARGNFLSFGQAPDFNLVVQSVPNANGTVSISVEDFFFKKIFEETYPFTTDSTGKSTIILDDLSSDILVGNFRGVFVVSADFDIVGVNRTFRDYFRFSVMDFLDNTHKNKDLFNLTYVYSLQSGGPEMDRFLERERAVGFGSIAYDFEKFANDLDLALDGERMQKVGEYGFGYMGRPVVKIHDGVGGEISEQNGAIKMINIKTRTNPSSIELLDFSSICALKSASRPWNDIWWFTGESNPGCWPLETYPTAFAKFLLATLQGIKSGNPQAKVLIEGGPWNLDPTLGTLWVERYIQDTKLLDPTAQFDGAAAHHYRNFPENPDLDSDVGEFLAMLDRNGHGDWPFYINEGGNYCPFDIPEEGISPYVVHSANSWYIRPLSYHSGRSERISSAFSARNWLVALKYQDRLACMQDFFTPNRYVDIDFTSRFYEKIPNTLGRLLGNASFVSDIVFAPNCRGYLFTEDGTGSPIAVVWNHNESVDRWEESPPLYTFDFGGQNVTFIDLMENEVNFPLDCDGRTVIPISPFPLFIKGLPGTENQLSNTIANYGTGIGTLTEIMSGAFHNGSLTANAAGFWNSTPDAIPAGWTETSIYCYSTATGFVQAGSTAQAENNTGEIVQASHRYTVSAGLGGVTGNIATVQVYATANSDGTGNKVLLAEVSRSGNDADGFTLFPVAGTPGSLTAPGLAGYYVQVMLTTSGYYDDLVVTSESETGPACGDAGYPYPTGDLNQDCYVNWQDFLILSDQWLAGGCANPNWCNGADLDTNTNVNSEDLTVFTANWLDCTNPNPPCCYVP